MDGIVEITILEEQDDVFCLRQYEDFAFDMTAYE